MNLDSPALQRDVARYLATGQADPLGRAFPGHHALEQLTGYERCLRAALIAEVCRREHVLPQEQVPLGFNSNTWTRGRVEPMIRSLFPRSECQIVLQMAERSIVFLTREATHQILHKIPYLENAWTIANTVCI